MKVGDVAPDVFLCRVAQHVEFGLVGPDDDAVTVDEVQTYGPIVEEVVEVLTLPTKFLNGPMQLGGLVEAVDGADEPAVLVRDRLDVDRRDDPRPVRSLDNKLLVMDRLPRSQYLPHRESSGGHRLPSGL